VKGNPVTQLDRRALLQALALAPVANLIPATLRAEATQAGLISSDVCMLSKEVTEGPFYVDPKLIRADITEGKPGLAMTLRLQVVNADCTPVAGARVDIWHCDANGAYSGVQNLGGGEDTTGQTFLRGTQSTDDKGIARFQTIYPGWYPGRTVHIHYKVILDDNAVLTSQIFFEEGVSDQAYAADAAYQGRGARDMSNAQDGIAQDAGDGAYCTVEAIDGQMTASMVVGINPDGRSGGWMNWLFG
jgi:protocatechuate 3,4-dioxygenase beta subunit